MPRKATPKGPVAFKEPRKFCPFGGQELRVVELSTGEYQVRGWGWVSTRLFQTEEQARYYFSHNEGLPPAYKTTQQRIQVTHGTVVPEAKEDGVTEDIDRAFKVGESMVGELTKGATP